MKNQGVTQKGQSPLPAMHSCKDEQRTPGVRAPLSPGEVASFFEYDQAAGVVTFARSTALFNYNVGLFVRMAGRRAGRRTRSGYVEVRFGGRNYQAHRLAWCLAHGEWPKLDLDHINGVKDDNRIANLRLATKSQNSANQRRGRKNAAGLKGAYPLPSGRFQAVIGHQRKHLYIGSFDTAEQAHEAYCRASVELHGEFGRTV